MATIVLASADSSLFETFQAEIEGMGHTLHWALDGLEALELVAEHHPLLLFLDSPLERFSTFETAEHVRADPDIPSQLPIIYVSDHPESSQPLTAIGITTVFPRTHSHRDLEELVARYWFDLQHLLEEGS